MHIPEREKCNWIREQIETIDPVSACFLLLCSSLQLNALSVTQQQGICSANF
jgi:hypothetical protein